MKINNFKKKPVVSTFKLPSRAKAAAKEVSDIIRAGGVPVMGKVMKKVGYATSTTKRPTQLTQSQEFQEAIDPVVKQMIALRNQAMKRMKETADKASYRDVTDSLDKLTKNIQLLSGKSTENIASKVIILPSKREE
jgi:hypothetical protein